MNDAAVSAASRITATAFSSFSDATRGILEMLETQLSGSVVFVGHLDHEQDRFWIVDARGDESFGLQSGSSVPLQESFCLNMAAGRAPMLCEDAGADPVYSSLAPQAELDIGSYVGVPLERANGGAFGSLCAISHAEASYSESDLQLLQVMARLLAFELEREGARRTMEQLHERLRDQASTDPLTGTLNRRAFETELELAWQHARATGERVRIVAIADLDGFKRINDTCGHAAGDRILRAVAAALQSLCGERDLAGRLGGDEFAVLLADEAAARSFSTELEARVLAIGEAEGTELGVSLGWAPIGGESPEADLHEADSAMYCDKRGEVAAR